MHWAAALPLDPAQSVTAAVKVRMGARCIMDLVPLAAAAVIVVVVLALPPSAASASGTSGGRLHQHALDGIWTLTNKARGLQAAGRVPGGVYSDLRAAGHLPEDLFYRFNDVAYRWPARENWTYERSFQVPRGAVAKAKQVLVLHGVDTVADVYLNGHLLGHTDNMFVRYRFDVKDLLKEDAANLLEVHFTSPVLAAAARAARQAEQYVVPPTCPPANYHGECSVNLLRKMQASFAWDWGPAFPSAGLWKGVALEAYDEAVLRDVGFDASPGASGAWEARVRVHWEAGAGARPAAPAATSAVLSVVLAPADGGAPIASKDVPVTLVPDAHGLGHTDVGLSVPRVSHAGVRRNTCTPPKYFNLVK
ncbi:beta-mannosidase-like [Frankliniella occidentalis]|uniref:beta-mannosidase n=1 Tax=Frankliniella occidentalis TaxID=133901 RepID=A0A9C6X0B4_FRAOC|nr:beta-mannosidase-like [Frankliniella occidentalis]